MDKDTNDSVKGQSIEKLSLEYRHAAYSTERRYWNDRVHSESLALDKALLTLSSGGIGLTVLLLTGLFNKDPLGVWTIALVVLSWVAFLVCIISLEFSYVWSRKAISAVIDELDQTFKGDDTRTSQAKRIEYDTRTENRDKIARWSFVVGVVLSLAFAVSGLFS